MSELPKHVVVIIGVGSIGLAITNRIVNGRQLVLADYSKKTLEPIAKSFRGNGLLVTDRVIDVADYASVEKLAQEAATLGPLDAVVVTAGLSSVAASTERIFQVNLVGTANIIDAFKPLVHGTSVVCTSSLAAHIGAPISHALSMHFAKAPIADLLTHAEIDLTISPLAAYAVTKRANQLRVQANAFDYGSRGSRINTISPGLINTPMSDAEIEGPSGEAFKRVVAASAARRTGSPQEIANAVAFLVGSDASFITGTDILVDGGATAAYRLSGQALL